MSSIKSEGIKGIIGMKTYKKGATLAIVLIMMAILSILMAALLNISLAETRFAASEEKRLQAYYIARAGAEAAAGWICNPANDKDAVQALLQKDGAWSNFGGGRFMVEFPIEDINSPQIKVTGQIEGKYNRVVYLTLKKNYLLSTAVTVTNMLTLGNNSGIYGDVQSTVGATISGPMTNIHGVYTSEVIDVFPRPSDPALPWYSPSHPPTAPQNTWNISSNTTTPDSHYEHSFNDINLSGSNTLEFQLNGDKKIYCNSFYCNNGTINVTGSGHLYIYTKSLNFKGNLTTSSGAGTMFVILNDGSVNLQTGSSEFEASIYGPEAEIIISANLHGVGAIVAENASLTSGGEVHYSASSSNFYPEDLGFPSMGYSKGMMTN